MSRAKRNTGIDLLRLVAMLMIVTHHLILHGGLLKGDNVPTGTFYAGNILNVLVYPTINCYAMISGFGGYKNTKIKYGKYVSMWIQVFTYSAIWGIIGFFFFETGGRSLLFSFFPVMSRQYWYFSAYTGVFFLAPFLNKMIENISKKDLDRLVFVIFSLFIVFNTIGVFLTKEIYESKKDIFNLNIGNTTFFMILMYFIGAWLRKNNIAEKIKNWQAILIFAVCSLCLILIRTKIIETPNNGLDEITKHNSIFMVGQSLALVVLFSNMKLKPCIEKITNIFYPSAFGVYLISDNSVFEKIEKTIVGTFKNDPWFVSIPLILLISFAIFIVSLLIEHGRGKAYGFFSSKIKLRKNKQQA